MNSNTTLDDRSPAAASVESPTTDCLSDHDWCAGPTAEAGLGDDGSLVCFDCFGVDCLNAHEWCDGVLPRPKGRLTGVQCADCVREAWAEL
jgi:hypothetical protein